MRYTTVRYHAHEMYACEVHAYEMHARGMHAGEIHAHEIHVHETHAYEIHAREMHVREIQINHKRSHMRFVEIWVCKIRVFALRNKRFLSAAAEGLINLDDVNFEINDDQVANETANIVKDEKRRRRTNELRGEYYSVKIMPSGSNRKKSSPVWWTNKKDLKLKDKVE
jgi:hypothetical protein